MAKQLGPIEITCDSPCYAIVKACHLVGLTTPEDVRWYRLSNFLVEHAGWSEVARMFSWHLLPVNRYLAGSKCTCGQALPRVRRCLFSTSTGGSFTYLLGQCPRCQTIFWEDAGAAAEAEAEADE
jgi:hypothetical protein